MAKDFKKQIHQSKSPAGEFQQQQDTEGNSSNSNKTSFTPEQRQMLGAVYQLILSWRREPKPAEAQIVSISSGGTDGTTLQQVMPVEVEA
jgi:hypothetical protein